MTHSIQDLRNFILEIIDQERSLASLQISILHYGIFLREILVKHRPSFMTQREVNAPSQMTVGSALSPWYAAACIEDRQRTAAFIKGAIASVEDALRRSNKRPLHLVEAGCGPLGTLILPLLAHFTSEELEVSVIDIHEESLDCMKVMFEHFNFLPRVREIACGDATNFDLKTKADLILTETMFVALSKEPQVAITLGLMKRNPEAVLIPQSIRVGLSLIDYRSELANFPLQPGKRKALGTVFDLNRETAVELKEEKGYLPAAKIQVKEFLESNHVLCLTTEVEVFHGIKISDYQTQITHPQPLQFLDNSVVVSDDILQFSYRLGDNPGLECVKVRDE